jgi:hypothetical protein
MLDTPGFAGWPKADEHTLVVAQRVRAGQRRQERSLAELVVVELLLGALQSSPHGAVFLLAFFANISKP